MLVAIIVSRRTFCSRFGAHTRTSCLSPSSHGCLSFLFVSGGMFLFFVLLVTLCFILVFFISVVLSYIRDACGNSPLVGAASSPLSHNQQPSPSPFVVFVIFLSSAINFVLLQPSSSNQERKREKRKTSKKEEERTGLRRTLSMAGGPDPPF